MPPKHSFRAHGKVLISGEYFVMEGALALGLPLAVGQEMNVKVSSGSEIVWKSLKPNGESWFTGRFDLFGFDCIKTSDSEIAERLQHILESAVRLNSDFLSQWKKYTVETVLEFEPDWGLGTSSTLISCLARWADVDPHDLLEVTFGGSGYDIACATAEGPIYYQLQDDGIRIEAADFRPNFSSQLYFVYLGEKQSSRESLASFDASKVRKAAIDEISEITQAMCNVSSLGIFEKLIVDHERLVSELLGQPRAKADFADYWGEIKSLGAWGGDFLLVTSDRSAEETRNYFKQKDLNVFFTYDQLAIPATKLKETSVA